MDKIRALIVDDSSVMRKIVERSLRQSGIELEKVVEASNGAEALVALQNNVVDLILCDINMPVMDGLEFVRQVAKMESAKGIPIVMITTEGSESHVVEALSAGARGYIRKPFRESELFENLARCLHIKYVYAEEAAGSLLQQSAATAALSAKTLSRLPKDLVQAIRDTASGANLKLLLTLISQLETHGARGPRDCGSWPITTITRPSCAFFQEIQHERGRHDRTKTRQHSHCG